MNAVAVNSPPAPTRKPSWVNRFYHHLRGPNPLHPRVWYGRLSPMKFRRFEPRDLEACLEIYTLNEPGRFPPDAINDYRTTLTEERTYCLVGETSNRVVATGGLSYVFRTDNAVLSFGLVHPDFHGKGIGASLVLCRLALLNPRGGFVRVMIFAVEKSIGYYRRFGFRSFTPWKDKTGQLHPSGVMVVSDWEVNRCRELLLRHGISWPADENTIPVRGLEELRALEGTRTETGEPSGAENHEESHEED